MVDTQGLLDRVFPLPADPTEASTSSSHLSYSLRALLKESPNHPLRVLRTAIQHLFPISSHARSRPSTPAAQQLRFCNLALALLNQASFNSVSIPLDIETILPQDSEEATRPKFPSRRRKYALLQRLPTGDWWTSLDSHFAAPPDGKELKDLPTAHAELVAVLPTPSISAPAGTDLSLRHPTIGTLFPRKPPGPKQVLPGPRYVSAGSFLDYGPYASYAPTFDQDGTEVGRDTLGELLWNREVKRRLRARQRTLQLKMQETQAKMTHVGLEHTDSDVRTADVEQEEEDLLSPSDVEGVKSLLDTLELEQAVQELLDRNSRALQNLEKLQKERLGREDGAFAQVEVGSEEWETAQAIMDTLTVLASLRPRSSNASDVPLVPSDAVLRKLHRTLPVGPSQGWYGTLQPTRPAAVRDDMTLQIKSGVSVPPASGTAVPTTPAASKTVAAGTTATPSYPYYPGYGGGQYRYTPGQTPAYYPPSYSGNQPPANGSAYYGQYQGGQQAGYPYAGWYNYQPPAQQSGTPSQPTATAGTGYAGYYGANQTPQAQRAVANTVSAKPYQAQPSTWTPTASAYSAPTLPSHLRTSGSQGTPTAPATPQPSGTAPSYQQYYSYQSTAR
ncbi:hypothetical protein GLOTRDRAFT_53754 [Gloeophyllum trabeum ATCC 11539]|uniref:Uncharacterized protein n=1 Tax=Gloeophyllum trabeum (strain ATCC 11539 / FP-39264 / Madison 617) TaxID=670483 RepID=S7S0Z9_GLOTA|nr:uncharacterized protein GLOTRDRAFT_53754 [Gloeophyllum trabeum ATCC 11539]EPQ61050.1 hypothetical protein GLOTRDRAFT_53754 [Gloeophyllum trabeum ATCC 11539]